MLTSLTDPLPRQSWAAVCRPASAWCPPAATPAAPSAPPTPWPCSPRRGRGRSRWRPRAAGHIISILLLSGARGQEEDGADGVLAAGGLPAHGDHPARHGGVQGQPLQRWKQPRDPSCVSSICIHMTDGSLTLEVGLDSRLYMPDQPIQVR